MPKATIHDAAKHETAIRKLQADNARLLRQLDEAKGKSRDLVEAVYRAAREAADQVSYRPVAPPRAERRTDDPETAVLLVSDWQLGKRTPTYSTEVCAKRIALYADRVRRLVDIQRADRPIRKAIVCLLGDLVEGETIFPGQSWRIDSSLFRQTLLDGPEILGTLLRNLLAYFEEVEVHDVIGNHGRLGRRGEYHPETNADAMLYYATHQQLKGEARLRWTPNYAPGERAWHRVFNVGQNSFFLFHGDQMRGGGFAGIPMYGFIRAMMSWASGTLPQEFRYAACVTPDTEALTQSGWRRYTEIRSGDLIATLHKETGAFEWQPAIINVLHHDGPVHHFRNNVMDHIMTPDHNMWTRLASFSSPGKRRPYILKHRIARTAWRLRPAASPVWGNWTVKTAASDWVGRWMLDGLLAGKDPGDIAELFGWYVAEGSADTQVRIAQSREVNPEKYTRIVALTERLGFKPYCSPYDVRICSKALAQWFSTTFGRGAPHKFLPDWVLDWPAHALDRLLEAAVLGDGSVVSKSCWQYYTTSQRLAEAVQEIAIKTGWSAQVHERRRHDRTTTSYELSLVRRAVRTMPRQHKIEHYSGTVWCPTVPNGLWFARRNGKVVVTGNCGHWHSSWSIPINQTHEGLARILWINGSTESDNEWLREEIKAQSPPSQWLLFAHDRRGVTVEHRVWL